MIADGVAFVWKTEREGLDRYRHENFVLPNERVIPAWFRDEKDRLDLDLDENV